MVHRLSRVSGFHVHGRDGVLGHVDDFLVGDGAWQIHYLLVDTSNWLGGKWVAIATSNVTRIDWTEREIQVPLTRDQIRASPGPEAVDVPSYELMPPVIIM